MRVVGPYGCERPYTVCAGGTQDEYISNPTLKPERYTCVSFPLRTAASTSTSFER
jgi:hypothetical protein